jgi:hypothetical protein
MPHDAGPIKNKTFEQVCTEVTKVMKKYPNLSNFQTKFDSSCEIIAKTLGDFTNLQNKESWDIHLGKFKNAIEGFKKNFLDDFNEYALRTENTPEKADLEKVHKILTAWHGIFAEVYRLLSTYNRSTNFIDLIALGTQVKDNKRNLPLKQRSLADLEWAQILIHRLKC